MCVGFRHLSRSSVPCRFCLASARLCLSSLLVILCYMMYPTSTAGVVGRQIYQSNVWAAPYMHTALYFDTAVRPAICCLLLAAAVLLLAEECARHINKYFSEAAYLVPFATKRSQFIRLLTNAGVLWRRSCFLHEGRYSGVYCCFFISVVWMY